MAVFRHADRVLPLMPLRMLPRRLRRTKGNPFFMEEMVRALFEQDVLYLDQVAQKETDIPHLLRERLSPYLEKSLRVPLALPAT